MRWPARLFGMSIRERSQDLNNEGSGRGREGEGSLEWEWHFQPFRETDFGGQAISLSKFVPASPAGNWSGNKAISDFPPVSTKVSSSQRSIFEGSPPSASVRASPIFGKDRGEREKAESVI